MTDLDLDQIEEELADLLADGAKSKLWRTTDVVDLVARVRKAEAERDEARESVARLNRRSQIAESAINELANGTGKGKAKSVAAEVWARCNRSHEAAFHEIREHRELSAERDELRATVARVEALHRPVDVEVLAGDCAAEECGHEDECPTVTVQQCVECDRLAESVDTYYGERDIGDTKYPCPTAKALRGESE